MLPSASLRRFQGRSRQNTKHCAALLILAGCLFACADNPIKQTLKHCPDCTPAHLETEGNHPLVAYQRNTSNSGKTLHIYLEGDGRPWQKNGIPNTNPNTFSYTALELMALDDAPSVYLNRPCYGLKKIPDNCRYSMWTSHRYSEDLVNVLATAIKDYTESLHYKKVVLIGHSGGGTIAAILASRLDNVNAVVTIAANLDHSAWTKNFGYRPLTGSINAIDVFPLKNSIKRWHIAGEEDRTVPWQLTYRAAEKDFGSTFILYEGFDHHCCWQDAWEAFIKKL